MSFERAANWGVPDDAEVIEPIDREEQLEMDLAMPRGPAEVVSLSDYHPGDPEQNWKLYLQGEQIPASLRGMALIQLKNFVLNNTEISEERRSAFLKNFSAIWSKEHEENLDERNRR